MWLAWAVVVLALLFERFGLGWETVCLSTWEGQYGGRLGFGFSVTSLSLLAQEDFFSDLKLYFPQIYDIKYAHMLAFRVRSCLGVIPFRRVEKCCGLSWHGRRLLLRYLMKSCEGLKGGLNKLAEDLEVNCEALLSRKVVVRSCLRSYCVCFVHVRWSGSGRNTRLAQTVCSRRCTSGLLPL